MKKMTSDDLTRTDPTATTQEKKELEAGAN